MALAKIPLVSFLSLSSLVPVTVCLLGHLERRKKSSQSMMTPAASASSTSPSALRFQLVASAIVVLCNVALLALEQPAARHEGYFWMEVHCLCSCGLVLYGRLADARYDAVDRQYYSYVFSLVVLLPASLYLEEAFEALHFKGLYQTLFVGGSLACAVLGVALHFQQTRLRSSERRFGQLHHLACLVLASASLPAFSLDLESPAASALAGLAASAALLFVPTHLGPEETASTSAASTAAAEADEQDAEPLMAVQTL